MITDHFGWIGQMMLLVCSVPQAYMSWKNGNSDGLSKLMIWLWGGGMFFSIFYFISISSIPAIINYCFNMAVWSIIAWYRYFPRREKHALSASNL
jgi:uncharacterized protein with PQ loop repeat